VALRPVTQSDIGAFHIILIGKLTLSQASSVPWCFVLWGKGSACLMLIHRSSWNRNSTNFAGKEF